jgi:hypothetical protein
LQDLRGERPTVGPCIARGLAVLPRVAVAALLLFLAIFAITFAAVLVAYGVGIAFSAVTGQGISAAAVSVVAAVAVIALVLALFVTWWVAVPSIVMENIGAPACFRRSRALTKGHRWSILGIVALVFLANFCCGYSLNYVGAAGAVATAGLLNVVVTLAFTACSSVLTAVGYYALRREKEGFGLGDLARVFD